VASESGHTNTAVLLMLGDVHEGRLARPRSKSTAANVYSTAFRSDFALTLRQHEAGRRGEELNTIAGRIEKLCSGGS
jgi:hypothetical protein